MKKDAGSVEDGRDGTPAEPGSEGAEKPKRKHRATGRPAHRPSLLTPVVFRKIVDAVGTGLFHVQAAALAGVSERVLQDWMTRGRQDVDSDHGRLLRAIKEAEAQAEARMVQVIAQAPRDPDIKAWAAAAWFLERKYPERYGQRRLRSAAVEDLEVEKLKAEIAKLKREAEESKADKTPASLDITIRDLTTEPKTNE